jgi:hypothetical protein
MFPSLPPLLHIYDASDRSIRLTAWIRRNSSMFASVYPVPVDDGLPGLRRALDKLVSARKTFQHCVFETHGHVGGISFRHEGLEASNIVAWLGSRGYERLFPLWSRIYFNGCNIADDDGGWDFLDAAGKIFLHLGGGETFAQTGRGTLLPWDYLNGHIHHFWSDTCYSRWFAGGVFLDHRRK